MPTKYSGVRKEVLKSGPRADAPPFLKARLDYRRGFYLRKYSIPLRVKEGLYEFQYLSMKA